MVQDRAVQAAQVMSLCDHSVVTVAKTIMPRHLSILLFLFLYMSLLFSSSVPLPGGHGWTSHSGGFSPSGPSRWSRRWRGIGVTNRRLG